MKTDGAEIGKQGLNQVGAKGRTCWVTGVLGQDVFCSCVSVQQSTEPMHQPEDRVHCQDRTLNLTLVGATAAPTQHSKQGGHKKSNVILTFHLLGFQENSLSDV